MKTDGSWPLLQLLTHRRQEYEVMLKILWLADKDYPGPCIDCKVVRQLQEKRGLPAEITKKTIYFISLREFRISYRIACTTD